MFKARIAGVGSYLPKRCVSNGHLKGMIRGFDEAKAGMPFEEWVENMTGIGERYYISEEEDIETMGEEASRKAIEDANLKIQDIEFLILTSFTQKREIPNSACSLAHRLGLDTIPAFPLNTACAGFLYGMAIAYSFIKSGWYKNILIVSAECLSRAIDPDDPRVAVLLGDGAGAAVLQVSSETGICSQPFIGSLYSDHLEYLNSDFQIAKDIGGINYIKKSYLKMPGGPQVLRRAVNSMSEAAICALSKSPWSAEDIDYLIPHQANARIIDGVAEKLNFPKEKVISIIKDMGNNSSATIPITLEMAVHGKIQGKNIKRKDKLLFTTVGGGYSVASVVMEY
ncbi:hypothetical protein B9J78_02375 [bacterium Unc6]|nr:hypothetical protein [bacterium Unc6]